jgi:ubiquinone/menaquinone biosynthesis C-methylase UbiE
MLEVGAGTGRFATFLRDNYPYATLTVSDLSPFYLEEACNNMRYWQEKKSSSSILGAS